MVFECLSSRTLVVVMFLSLCAAGMWVFSLAGYPFITISVYFISMAD